MRREGMRPARPVAARTAAPPERRTATQNLYITLRGYSPTKRAIVSGRGIAECTRWRQSTPGSTARRYDPEGGSSRCATRGLDGTWPSRPVNGPSTAPLLMTRSYQQGRLHTRGAVTRTLLPGLTVSGPRAGLQSAPDSAPSTLICPARASMSPRSWPVMVMATSPCEASRPCSPAPGRAGPRRPRGPATGPDRRTGRR